MNCSCGFYLAVLDVEYGAFSCIWGNNPETDLAMPEIIRDKAKEDMIFERLEQWVWSLEYDKPPTMEDVKPKLALESLARIYGASLPGLPTVEFSPKYERSLRQIAFAPGEIASCNQEIKTYEKEMEAHSVRSCRGHEGARARGAHHHKRTSSSSTLSPEPQNGLIPRRLRKSTLPCTAMC